MEKAIHVTRIDNEWEVVEQPAIFGSKFPSEEKAIKHAKELAEKSLPNEEVIIKVQQVDGSYKTQSR